MASADPFTFHFEGQIVVPTGEDFTSLFIDLPFDVPSGIAELRLSLRFEPAQVGGVSNLITLGVFDPRGFRGNAHRNPPDGEVRLSLEAATAGFLPGPLAAGGWLAQLAAHAILQDDRPCRYSLDIALIPGQSGGSAPAAWQPDTSVLRAQAGWYRGELHSHTRHSDGSMTPAELVAEARHRGLDFLCLTDHNTHTGLRELPAQDADGPLIIPGIELTTFHGHALVLGISGWIDWRCGYQDWTMADAARETHRMGGLFIPAHPNDSGSPMCTGCRWEYSDFELALADGIEIWNETWWTGGEKNPGSLELWREQQARGARIPATAGTDIHAALDWSASAPSVYVYARELSAAAVLEGIRAGRLLLSGGPLLNFTVAAGAGEALCGPGDTCSAVGETVWLNAEWQHAPAGAQLVIRDQTDVIDVLAVSESGTSTQTLNSAAVERLWLELYGPDGELLALANPVQLAGRATKDR